MFLTKFDCLNECEFVTIVNKNFYDSTYFITLAVMVPDVSQFGSFAGWVRCLGLLMLLTFFVLTPGVAITSKLTGF